MTEKGGVVSIYFPAFIHEGGGWRRAAEALISFVGESERLVGEPRHMSIKLETLAGGGSKIVCKHHEVWHLWGVRGRIS